MGGGAVREFGFALSSGCPGSVGASLADTGLLPFSVAAGVLETGLGGGGGSNGMVGGRPLGFISAGNPVELDPGEGSSGMSNFWELSGGRVTFDGEYL